MSDAAPPSGGMGAVDKDVDPSSLPFGPTHSPLGRPSLLRRLTVLVGVVTVVGTSAGVSMRLYVNRAKTMEARVSLRKIAKLARASYERDGHFCASASVPVPEEMPPTAKYTPRNGEWQRDGNAGFACLGFEGPPVQHFQYSYVATDHDFTATARGHVLDDGQESVLTATGTLDHGELRIRKP